MSDCSPVYAPVCPVSGPGRVPAPRRFRGLLGPLVADKMGFPPKPSVSGFGGERRSSRMSEFSPFWAETRDMALATTRRRAGTEKRQAERAGVVNTPARPLLPAARAVSALAKRSCETAKNTGMGLQNRQPLLFSHFRRSCRRMEAKNMEMKKIKFPLWFTPETKEKVE